MTQPPSVLPAGAAVDTAAWAGREPEVALELTPDGHREVRARATAEDLAVAEPGSAVARDSGLPQPA